MTVRHGLPQTRVKGGEFSIMTGLINRIFVEISGGVLVGWHFYSMSVEIRGLRQHYEIWARAANNGDMPVPIGGDVSSGFAPTVQ
jgi:hypothetical protein